jgi:hypothetical protein
VLSGVPFVVDHGAVVHAAWVLCSAVLFAVSLRQQGFWCQGRTFLVHLLASLL